MKKNIVILSLFSLFFIGCGSGSDCIKMKYGHDNCLNAEEEEIFKLLSKQVRYSPYCIAIDWLGDQYSHGYHSYTFTKDAMLRTSYDYDDNVITKDYFFEWFIRDNYIYIVGRDDCLAKRIVKDSNSNSVTLQITNDNNCNGYTYTAGETWTLWNTRELVKDFLPSCP
jgi:hypothetical protein